MAQTEEQNKVKLLLTEAITSLCKTGLKYETEFCVEGLLGITLDNKDILLINIKEVVRPADVSISQNESPQILDNVNMNQISDCQNKRRMIPDIMPKRRKKRKSSNVSKRIIESPLYIEEKDHDSDFVSQTQFNETFQINDNPSPKKSKQFNDNFDDVIPNLANSDYMTLPYEDGDKDHVSDAFAHSNAIFPKEESYQLPSLQQSPKISLGEGIPLDLGLGHGDNGDLTTPSLGSGWDDDHVEMPLNLSETVKQEPSSCQVRYVSMIPCKVFL